MIGRCQRDPYADAGVATPCLRIRSRLLRPLVRSSFDPRTPFFAHIGHGCGNAAAVEITKRFPPRLGNLAQNARFPHSHSRLSDVDRNPDQDTNPIYPGVTNRLWEVSDLLNLLVESEGGKKAASVKRTEERS